MARPATTTSSSTRNGVHSQIRELAMGGPPARYVGRASWRFLAESVPEITDRTVMLGRGGAFLAVALGDSTVYYYAGLETGAAERFGENDWRESFADFVDPVPRLL
jgi:hypothetical protein